MGSRSRSAVICAKTAQPIEMPYGLWAHIGPVNHKLDEGLDHRGKRQLLRKMGAHCKVLGLSAEPIDLPFGL